MSSNIIEEKDLGKSIVTLVRAHSGGYAVFVTRKADWPFLANTTYQGLHHDLLDATEDFRRTACLPRKGSPA